MSDNTGIFDAKPADDQSTGEDALFIGEGKKYETIADADKAIAHKEEHIQKLEAENASLRDRTLKAKTIDDVLYSIDKTNNSVQPSTSQTSEGTGLDASQLDAIVQQAVEQKLNSIEAETAAERNAKFVVDDLVNHYGDMEKAEEAYKQAAEALNLDLDALAVSSPQAVINLVRGNEQPQVQPDNKPAPQSSVNTANLNSNAPDYGTKAYWDRMYAEGNISRSEKFKKEHESLNSMGASKFYG